MTTRITRSQLNDLAAMLCRITGLDYMVCWAYGRPRLYLSACSVEVSPRLPSRQLYEWMQAYLAGYEMACKRLGDLTGRTYVAQAGQFNGQELKVVGPDYLFPGQDKWLVQAPDGRQWGVSGDSIRTRLST